jgi:hypothetical protein
MGEERLPSAPVVPRRKSNDMDNADRFSDYVLWHSASGLDAFLRKSPRSDGTKAVPNTKHARRNFFQAGEALLIHKATRALWKVSDDGKHIEPVYDEEIIPEDIADPPE